MKLDTFTQAYIECALWSSTEYQFAECPCCGIRSLLSHYPEPEYDQVPMCSREGCGVREIANPPPIDRHYSADDIHPDSLAKMQADCDRFVAENRLPDYSPDYDNQRAGHDFWLTRNGHGAGFWDRDELTEDDQKRLTDAAHAFGECDLYAGDDGKLHIS